MSKLIVSQDTLRTLLEQAKASGNIALAQELEKAIKDAKTLKHPNAVEDWEDAQKIYKKGLLTIRKDAIRDAAKLLYELANRQPELRETVIQLFSRAMRNGDES